MTHHDFKFTGTAKEYFGIWSVNLFLSIITLGIYTAWAKVRRQRYFYANTYLDGHNFEYHGKPKAILIGRIIVVGALLVYNGLIAITPLAAVLVIPFLIAFPWVINKALRFNARVTSYRNIRLNFAGSYWRSMLVFALMPIVTIFSFGILAPFASRMRANYIGNNLRYGDENFNTDVAIGSLYRNWGASMGFFAIATALILIIFFQLLPGFIQLDYIDNLFEGFNLPSDQKGYFVFAFAFSVTAYLTGILAILFYTVGVRNLAYRHTQLGHEHKLTSNLGRSKYIWILVSNLFLVVATMGLMRPWAAIRTWRYKVENTGLDSTTDLDSFVEQRNVEGSAVSAEFLDIEGIDFGL